MVAGRTCIFKLWGCIISVSFVGPRVAPVSPRWTQAFSAFWTPRRTHVKGQEIHEDAQVEGLKVLNKLELLSKSGERARATGTSLPFLTEASTSSIDRIFTHNWPRRSRGAPPPSPTAGTRIVDHTDYQRMPLIVMGHG